MNAESSLINYLCQALVVGPTNNRQVFESQTDFKHHCIHDKSSQVVVTQVLDQISA